MRSQILIGFCLFAGVSQSSAAEATAEEAQRLVHEFHRYVGAPRAGQADHVRAVPEGEAYRITIDFDALATPLEPLGFSLDAAELSFLTQPLPDRTWHVSDVKLTTPLTIRIPGQTIIYRMEGIAFDGIYDPAIASWTIFEETIATTSSEVRAAQNLSTSHIGEQTVSGTAVPAAEGTVDVAMRQTLRDLVSQETVSLPASDENTAPPPPIEFAYSVDTGTVDVKIDGLDAVGLLDLWAYAVARAQESPPNIDQQELKTLLGELLPLFTRLDEGIALGGLQVGTPLGDFGMKDIDFRIALPGIVADGGIAMSMGLSGPSYPAEIVPQWAGELVPTALDIGFDLTGFNLDVPARHLIEAFDADREPPLEPADFTTAGMLALPEGGAKLTLRPSHIDGPILDVAFEGEMTMSMPAPTGMFTVTATGLDAAIEALTASADPIASQALGMLTAAQMWGRRTEDGSMEFVIVLKDDGSVVVNDQLVKPPAGDPT